MTDPVRHVGVLDHQFNPTPEQVVAEARAAEQAGADWLTLSDLSSWRDVWMMAALAAQATESVRIGPGMTNPFLRHPNHCLAALATLHELSGGRAILGIGAGGSALTDSIGVDRRRAPERVTDLVRLLREVIADSPLDQETGFSLDMNLPETPVLVAGRKDQMLRAAGAVGDWALVWRIPVSDLQRTVGVIRDGAHEARRQAGPDIVWCPLVEWDERIRPHLRVATVYAALESPPALLARWGLDAERRSEIRAVVGRAGTPAAAKLVPDEAVDDLVLADADPSSVAEIGRSIGATTIAIRNFETETIGAGVEWAREVAAQL
jgi:5,10-methylenetetrahydromethanopterin reductase